MPIRTQPSKSGQKRFHKNRTKAVAGRLNETARNASNARERGLTSGLAGLRDPVKPGQNRKAGRSRVVRSNRVRRVLP
jgi:hypothetical protein